MSDRIIGLQDWFETPPGRYLLAWERPQFDAAVADIFGYHALQLGLPELDALRANRMPHRWLAMDQPMPVCTRRPTRVPALLTDFAALPFPASQPRSGGAAARAGVHRRPACHLARGGAGAGARGAGGDLRLQSGQPVGPAPAARAPVPAPGAGATLFLPELRRVHRLLAPARLAAPAGLRGRGRAPSAATGRRCDSEKWLQRYGWMDRAGRALVADSSARCTFWWRSSACAACACSVPAWKSGARPRPTPRCRSTTASDNQIVTMKENKRCEPR